VADIQGAAGPAGVGFQEKRPQCPVKCKPFRPDRIVRVVRFEFPTPAGFRGAKQDDAMVNGHRREFHQVKNGKTVLFEGGGQCN